MTAHTPLENACCQQPEIVRKSFHEWECARCGCRYKSPSTPEAKVPVAALLWAIASITAIVTLLSGFPARQRPVEFGSDRGSVALSELSSGDERASGGMRDAKP
ncbi:MAG: hypothetical protein ACFB9N_09780 [Geitlerinemataceae cyanobacterium]|mgnify:CR=1 FL=1